MASDKTFDMFHKYSKLVRRGLAKPLTHDCGGAYTYALGAFDEFVLKCLSCDTTVTPGENTLGAVRAITKEHFLD